VRVATLQLFAASKVVEFWFAAPCVRGGEGAAKKLAEAQPRIRTGRRFAHKFAADLEVAHIF